MKQDSTLDPNGLKNDMKNFFFYFFLQFFKYFNYDKTSFII